MSKKNKKLSRCVLISSLISFPFTLLAELEITPELDISEIYTDNVTLAEEGQEESDFITRLAPSLTARLRSSSTNLDFIYRLEHFISAEDSDRNATYQQFQLNSNTELIRDNFFIDLFANKDQTVIDPDEPISGNYQDTGNRTDIVTFDISPYLRFPVFSFAQSELRYRYLSLNYGDDGVTDSDLNQINFSVRSNRRSRRFTWQFIYDARETDFDDELAIIPDFLPLLVDANRDRVAKLEDVSLELNYRLNPSLALLGTTGYEKNELTDTYKTIDTNISVASSSDKISDSYWDLGFTWDLTRRTALELRRGERFHGDTYYGSFTGRGRFTNWGLSYTESFTTEVEQQINQLTRPDETLDPSSGTGPYTADPYLLKRADFNYEYSKGNNRFVITAYDLQREYIFTTNYRDEEYGGQARIDWRMLPRTTLSLTGNYQYQFREQTNSKTITREIGLRATRQMSSRSSGYLEYRNYNVEDVPTAVTRIENSVEARLEFTF